MALKAQDKEEEIRKYNIEIKGPVVEKTILQLPKKLGNSNDIEVNLADLLIKVTYDGYKFSEKLIPSIGHTPEPPYVTINPDTDIVFVNGSVLLDLTPLRLAMGIKFASKKIRKGNSVVDVDYGEATSIYFRAGDENNVVESLAEILKNGYKEVPVIDIVMVGYRGYIKVRLTKKYYDINTQLQISYMRDIDRMFSVRTPFCCHSNVKVMVPHEYLGEAIRYFNGAVKRIGHVIEAHIVASD